MCTYVRTVLWYQHTYVRTVLYVDTYVRTYVRTGKVCEGVTQNRVIGSVSGRRCAELEAAVIREDVYVGACIA